MAVGCVAAQRDEERARSARARESTSIAVTPRPRVAVRRARSPADGDQQRRERDARLSVTAATRGARQHSGVQHRRARDFGKRRRRDDAAVVRADRPFDFHVDHVARTLVRNHADERRGVVSASGRRRRRPSAPCRSFRRLRIRELAPSGCRFRAATTARRNVAQLGGGALARRRDGRRAADRSSHEVALLVVDRAHDARLHQQAAVGDRAVVARHRKRRHRNALSERHRRQRRIAPLARAAARCRDSHPASSTPVGVPKPALRSMS